MVLIARLDDGHTLYAVEREDRGLYVLCQLGSWINIQQLRAAAIASKVESLPKTTERPIKDNDLVPLITPELSKYSKKKRLAIEAIQSMLKRPSAGVLSESQPAQAIQLLSASKNQDQLLSETVVNDVSVQLTAVEIFENLRNQYFEALYSKAWLLLPLCLYSTNDPRHRWRISQKGHYQELVQHSTLIMIPPWI